MPSSDAVTSSPPWRSSRSSPRSDRSRPAREPGAARTRRRRTTASRPSSSPPGDLAELQARAARARDPVLRLARARCCRPRCARRCAAEVARVLVQEGESRRRRRRCSPSLDTADLQGARRRAGGGGRGGEGAPRPRAKNQANNKALLGEILHLAERLRQRRQRGAGRRGEPAERRGPGARSRSARSTTRRSRAPFAGIVAKRWVNVGDKVVADMPVAHGRGPRAHGDRGAGARSARSPT